MLVFLFVLQLQAESNAWLRMLNNNSLITQVSIPGTRESGAYGFLDASDNTQGLSLQQQLDLGVRYFDFRVDADMNIVRVFPNKPPKPTLLSFSQGQAILREFLEQHPSEFLVLRIQAVYQSEVSNFADELLPLLNASYYWPNSTIPQIGQIRGSIFLLQDFEANTSYFPYFPSANLILLDLTNATCEQHLIRDHLVNATISTWGIYLTYSGCLGNSNADDLQNFLQGVTRNGTLGIVAFDNVTLGLVTSLLGEPEYESVVSDRRAWALFMLSLFFPIIVLCLLGKEKPRDPGYAMYGLKFAEILEIVFVLTTSVETLYENRTPESNSLASITITFLVLKKVSSWVSIHYDWGDKVVLALDILWSLALLSANFARIILSWRTVFFVDWLGGVALLTSTTYLSFMIILYRREQNVEPDGKAIVCIAELAFVITLIAAPIWHEQVRNATIVLLVLRVFINLVGTYYAFQNREVVVKGFLGSNLIASISYYRYLFPELKCRSLFLESIATLCTFGIIICNGCHVGFYLQTMKTILWIGVFAMIFSSLQLIFTCLIYLRECKCSENFGELLASVSELTGVMLCSGFFLAFYHPQFGNIDIAILVCVCVRIVTERRCLSLIFSIIILSLNITRIWLLWKSDSYVHWVSIVAILSSLMQISSLSRYLVTKQPHSFWSCLVYMIRFYSVVSCPIYCLEEYVAHYSDRIKYILIFDFLLMLLCVCRVFWHLFWSYTVPWLAIATGAICLLHFFGNLQELQERSLINLEAAAPITYALNKCMFDYIPSVSNKVPKMFPGFNLKTVTTPPIGMWFAAIIFFFCFFLVPLLVSFPNYATNHDWLRYQNNQQLISRVFLVGTHDSSTFATWPFLLQVLGRCQTLSLNDQLAAGVRFFDLRVYPRGDSLYLVHGTFLFTFYKLDQVLNQFREFLDHHPTEFLVIRLKVDRDADPNSKNFSTEFEALNTSHFWNSSTIPTVSQARAKIVILINWADYPNPNSTFKNYSDLVDEDDYNKTDCGHDGVQKKLAVIQSSLRNSGNASSWTITYTSATATSPNIISCPPIAYSFFINPAMKNKILAECVGCSGILAMDFMDYNFPGLIIGNTLRMWARRPGSKTIARAVYLGSIEELVASVRMLALAALLASCKIFYFFHIPLALLYFEIGANCWAISYYYAEAPYGERFRYVDRCLALILVIGRMLCSLIFLAENLRRSDAFGNYDAGPAPGHSLEKKIDATECFLCEFLVRIEDGENSSEFLMQIESEDDSEFLRLAEEGDL